ncbi:MAG: helix-turn-helix transcriptional regulator [Saprospiraceae bacterium]
MPIEPEMNDIEVSNLVGSIYCPGPWYSYVFAINEARFISMHQNARQFYGKENNEVTIDDLIDRIHPDDHPFFLRSEGIIADFLTEKIDPATMFKYKMVYSYRFRDPSGKYRLLLHQCIAFARGPQGNMVASMGVHTFVDHLFTDNNYKLSIIGLDGYPSYLGMDILEDSKPLMLLDHPFSVREIEIIRKLSEGLSSKAIASELFISVDTVRTHRQNLLEKAKCHSTAELIAKCYQQGIL